MIAATHFLASAAIATKTPEALPAALAAIVLHFVMDSIPHKDYIGEPKLTPSNILVVIGDLALALVLFFLFVKPDLWDYAFGIGIIGLLPDAVELPGHFWPKWWDVPGIKQLHHWHGEVLQHSRELPFRKESWPEWFWGLLPQLLVLAVAIYFILV